MKFLLVFTLLCVSPLLSFAQNDDSSCRSAQPGCVAIGRWDVRIGVGIGIRDNPLIDSEDLPLFLLPDISYYGDRFFFDTYVGGFTFFETENAIINGITTISFDQIYFDTRNLGGVTLESGPFAYEASGSNSVASDGLYLVNEESITSSGVAIDPETKAILEPDEIIVLDRLHNRNTALLMGLELGYFPGRWDFSLQLLQDVTSAYSGKEARFALSRFLTLGDEHFEVASGVTWQDRKTLDYFWGVRESEVNNPDLAYKPSSGMSPFLRLDWRRKLARNWSLQATVHQRWLSDQVSYSPLVAESTVLTLFVGGVYHF